VRAADSARPNRAPSAAEAARRLASIGYAEALPVAADELDLEGVVLHDEELACPGWNLYATRQVGRDAKGERYAAGARLVDNEGRLRHRWATQVRGETLAWIEEHLPSFVPEYMTGWNHVELLPDGDLLAVGNHHLLARFDRDAELVWKLDIPAHHDVRLGPDGNLYTLIDGLRTVELDGEPVVVQDNWILMLTQEGEELRRWSLWDAYQRTDELAQRLLPSLRKIPAHYERALARLEELTPQDDAEGQLRLELYRDAVSGDYTEHTEVKNVLVHGYTADIFHSNSIQVLERDEPGLWEAGDLLVSIRIQDTVAVLDRDTGAILWEWGPGELELQHHATWLEDGTILVFDNGARRGWSRILRVDPRSREVVWEYHAEEPEDFFTEARGGVQPLPNGNFLVAESNPGRVFEVTPEKEIAWEFYGPIRAEREGEALREAIYRMTRLPKEALGAFRGPR